MDQKFQEGGQRKKTAKVALLCGAFNPITLGHVKLAQFVLSRLEISEVWLNPCFQHLYNKQMVSPEHRLAMCRLAAKVDGRIKVFDYEIEKKLKGETYHFVKNLLNEPFAQDEYDFSYIIGLDNANTFDKWVNYQDLERMIRFVVVSRKGIVRDTKVDWYLKPPHIYLEAENEIPEVSSTLVRNNLDNYWNKSIGAFGTNAVDYLEKELDPSVFDYIVENKLYA